MYTIYIGSAYAVDSPVACTVFSAFFHYTFTTTLVAIIVDAVYLFLTLFRKVTDRYHILAACITWGKWMSPVTAQWHNLL